MSDFEFPLLIASVDSSSQLSVPEQAQAFFASSVVKPSSPAIIISCFNGTSLLFPNLLNTLLSSCSIDLPTSPGIWLRHVYQQDDQTTSGHPTQRPRSLTKGAVASPARDDNSGTVILLLDIIATGLNQVCNLLFLSVSAANFSPPFPQIVPPIPQTQQARLFSLAYSISSHILVSSESCELSFDFNFATTIAESIQVSTFY